ncbi:MAG: hypothetical protein IPO25_19890 [Saprospiraceae bacterium]|nr:hypothetical protein [Saprospiraceae bacterium]
MMYGNSIALGDRDGKRPSSGWCFDGSLPFGPAVSFGDVRFLIPTTRYRDGGVGL